MVMKDAVKFIKCVFMSHHTQRKIKDFKWLASVLYTGVIDTSNGTLKHGLEYTKIYQVALFDYTITNGLNLIKSYNTKLKVVMHVCMARNVWLQCMLQVYVATSGMIWCKKCQLHAWMKIMTADLVRWAVTWIIK